MSEENCRPVRGKSVRASTAMTWMLRVCIVPLATVMVLLLSVQPMLAAPLDVKSLAIPASYLGAGWTLTTESVSSTPDLSQAYYAEYTNYASSRDAVFALVQFPNAAVAELNFAALRQQSSSDDPGVQVWPGLGDGGGLGYGAAEDGEYNSAFIFRVQNVLAVIMLTGPETRAVDVGGQAIGYVVLQHDRLRAALQSGALPTDTLPAYPYCAAGQAPRFQGGFAALHTQLGPRMGLPSQCEHPNLENGDVLQLTSAGLAIYRESTNTPTFTNGSEHWALTPSGSVYWAGESVDPPAAAFASVQP